MIYKKEIKQLGFIALLLLLLIGGIMGYQLYEHFNYAPITQWFETSAFIVWFSTLNSRIGSIALIIVPIILIYGSCYSFYERYHSGIIEEMIIRDGYFNVMKKELKRASLKSLIFPGVMLMLFIFFLVSGPGLTLDVPENASLLTMLPWGSSLSYQFLMVFFVLVSEWFFGIFLVFLTFSIIPFTKKFYLVLLYSFIVINIFNYIISILGKYIFGIINIYPENVYEVMMSDSIPRTLVTLPICLFIAITIYYIIYRKKDMVILKRD